MLEHVAVTGDRDARAPSWSTWWNYATWQTTISVQHSTVCHQYVITELLQADWYMHVFGRFHLVHLVSCYYKVTHIFYKLFQFSENLILMLFCCFNSVVMLTHCDVEQERCMAMWILLMKDIVIDMKYVCHISYCGTLLVVLLLSLNPYTAGTDTCCFPVTCGRTLEPYDTYHRKLVLSKANRIFSNLFPKCHHSIILY